MPLLKFNSLSEDQTKQFARRLAKSLSKNDCLALVGDFGSGKTTFVKGLAGGMGVTKNNYVRSPSFVILKIYRGRLPIYHFDIYRINRLVDFEYIGVDDFLDAGGVTVVEWADRFEKLLPKDRLKIKFFVTGVQKRRLEFYTSNLRLKNFLKRMTG